MNLETRLEATTEELAQIRESVLNIQDDNMAMDLSGTKTDFFEIVLNEAQFTAYNSNAMTKSLCDDLLKF